MGYLHDRESALVALLTSAFPGHRVRVRTVEPRRVTEELIVAGPEISIGLRAWQGSAGALVWSVLLIEDDRRAAESRRLGITGAAEPSGLLASLALLRETLRTASGAAYAVRGGKLIPAPPALLFWEEEIEEYDFAMQLPYAPALATHVTEGTPLAAPTEALDTHFDELDALTPGARVLVTNADGTDPRDLGIIVQTEPGRNELVVSAPVALAAGTRLFTANGIVLLPRALRWREREELDTWRPFAMTLDGRGVASRVSARSRDFHFDIACVNATEEAALRGFIAQLDTVAQWLFLAGDGSTHAVVPRVVEHPLSDSTHSPWRISGTITTPKSLEIYAEES